MYERKTYDEFQILTNYGYGWEVEDREFTLQEAKKRKKEYLNNIKADVKIRKKRIKIGA